MTLGRSRSERLRCIGGGAKAEFGDFVVEQYCEVSTTIPIPTHRPVSSGMPISGATACR